MPDMPDRYLYMMRAGLEEGFRVAPMADVRLYDRGAEGYLLDVGQGVYDIIGESHETAEYSTRQFGQVTQSELLYVPELGALIPRPLIARHDTQLSDWLVSDHNWLTPELPSYHNQQFLWMSDVSPYVNATAQSKWDWPEGADCAFDLLLLPPVRCEFAPEKHEPFAFVTFGGNQWGLLFPAGGTTTLHRWVGDGWQEVAQLGGSSDNINFFDFTSAAAYQVVSLNYRGRLVISTDAGQNWTAIEVEEEVLLPSGPMTCRLYGMAGGLILHQVKQYEGTY